MNEFLKYPKTEIEKRTGCLAQLCNARKLSFSDGLSKGLEIVDVHSGSGLDFQILTDRGMGIGRASYKGIPICWISPLEEVSPTFYNPQGDSWLETFGGGMVTSCGLTNVGGASVVDGLNVGLHGRLSHIPAKDVSIEREWKDNSYQIKISGYMTDASVMGHNFELKRTYIVKMGSNEIYFHDEIKNCSDRREPLFVLYHLNFGYPFISENTKIVINDRIAEPKVKDNSYYEQRNSWQKFSKPQKDISELVYYHSLERKNKNSMILIENQYSDMKLSAEVSFPLQSLNHLVEWKMLGEKNYLLGIEPGNTFASGRTYSFENKDVEYLEPEEIKKIDMHLKFKVSIND